jgi:DNA-binding MarR family transcriptional regulator
MRRRGPDEAGDRSEAHAEWVRELIRLRRLRAKHFDQELFADPAWDILLDLYAAQLEGRRTTVSSLAIAAAVPPTTALRWIQKLTSRGLLVRVSEGADRRRVYIELSAGAYTSVEAYLGEAGSGQFII